MVEEQRIADQQRKFGLLAKLRGRALESLLHKSTDRSVMWYYVVAAALFVVATITTCSHMH